MNLSILHISDLHRDPENPMQNNVLMNSLTNDCDRFSAEECAKIRKPDLIIVSGDIIYGVKANDFDAEMKLHNQYKEALDFLSNLSKKFVGGNKERVIIVPGNHDVSAYHFYASLEKIEIDSSKKIALARELFSPQSTLRWSWEEFALYKISDPNTYKERMRAFAKFYSDFYEGQRNYAINPEEQFDIFDYPEFGVSIVGFSSCHNNDLCNRQGSISPDCIANAKENLRTQTVPGSVRMAVWHHNTEGAPLHSDYMNFDLVQILIDSGFSLGFHGHHHRPQFLDIKFGQGVKRNMVISSAGTLCGAPSPGHQRSYNVIELDTTKRAGRLHVREVQSNDSFSPIWRQRPIPYHDQPFYEFKYDVPPPSDFAINAATSQLMKAQNFHRAGDYTQAADIFAVFAEQDGLARLGLLDCLLKLDDAESILKFFDPPKGPAEAVGLMDALWALGKKQRLSETIKESLICESTDPSVVELREKYRARLI